MIYAKEKRIIELKMTQSELDDLNKLQDIEAMDGDFISIDELDQDYLISRGAVIESCDFYELDDYLIIVTSDDQGDQGN